MFQLDLKSGKPICDQIVSGFIKMKALGVISSGDQLPSVRSLAVEFSVNPNTIQKAYAILESQGIIYSVKGKGSFVSDDNNGQQAILNSARNDFKNAVISALQLGLNKEELFHIIENQLGKEKI